MVPNRVVPNNKRMDGYLTDEDEEIACEDIAGSIEINDGLHVKYRQPDDTIDYAFFERVLTLILQSTCTDVRNISREDVQRMYVFLSARDMHERVTHMIEESYALDELFGSGLTYDLQTEVYVGPEGRKNGKMSFSVWIRRNVKVRLTPPTSPVPLPQFV